MIRLLPVVAAMVACQAAPISATSQPELSRAPVTVLHVLTGADGLGVRGALTELGGRLYGLAGERGPNGTSGCSSSAAWSTVEHTRHCPGSLFSLRLDGSDFRVEHAFSRLDDASRNADGYHPYGSPTASGGWLYGVTQMGGLPTAEPGEPGHGVLFRYDPVGGSFQALHHFGSWTHEADGSYPMGAVAAGPGGAVYGTAKGGGSLGTGTVWRWSPDGGFASADLPGETYGGVTLAGGLLHGTSWSGGAGGVGVYFTVEPATLAVTVVDSFPAFTWNEHGTDNTPIQEPTVLSTGGIVTAREFGGAAGAGIVAALDPRDGIRVLHDSADIPLEAAPRFANPTGGMLNGRIVEGRDGMLYGSAQYGGALGTGGIYRLARDGSLFALLWSWPDEAYPYGGLTVASDGALYGTTYNTNQVFRFTPPTGACAL